jgi:hypothetical protein
MAYGDWLMANGDLISAISHLLAAIGYGLLGRQDIVIIRLAAGVDLEGLAGEGGA